jgi:phosphoglycolate phosphatase
MNFKAVLFDLDGTLLNTLDDLADSMNAVLRSMGYPEHPVDAYRYFVGNGVRNLALRSLPQERRDDETVVRCTELMGVEYERRWAEKTLPYPGVVETIGMLHSRGVVLAVLSNKNDEFTKKTVTLLLPSHLFSIVRGHRKNAALKPDPAAALCIAGEIGLEPGLFAFVGDTSTDMKTAISAGMCPVGALWGFRTEAELVDSGAKHVIESPWQLFTFITGD